jgi:CheY-like chemotaxis protein
MPCKHLLIIEDDEAVVQSLRDVLEHHGYVVHTALDGKEGLEQLASSPESPCVIILDMMMPRMNGWQFLDVQRGNPETASIPVIVCSAFHESAKSVRPAAVVEKPIRLDRLVGTVKAFCA